MLMVPKKSSPQCYMLSNRGQMDHTFDFAGLVRSATEWIVSYAMVVDILLVF